MRVLISAILALSCGAIVAASSAERLFTRVYAQPGGECPAGLDRVGDAKAAVCATYADGIERLKMTLELYDDKPNPTVTRKYDRAAGLPPSYRSGRVLTFHRTWRKQQNLHIRDWLEDDELFVIAYDETSAALAVLPKDSCLEPQVRGREDLYFEGGPEFIAAEAIDAPLPPAPPRAPNGLRVGGDAVVQVVVDRNGAVGDACVMYSRPDRFGKAALKAVKAWTFVPATLEDRPVESIVSIAFGWRQGMYRYEKTARPVRTDG